jgi:hypothetical protein
MAYDSMYVPTAPAPMLAALGVEAVVVRSEFEQEKTERSLAESYDSTPASLDDSPVIPIVRYRKLMGDYVSTDARVVERLKYIEQFCQIIIQSELNKYEEETCI